MPTYAVFYRLTSKIAWFIATKQLTYSKVFPTDTSDSASIPGQVKAEIYR